MVKVNSLYSLENIADCYSFDKNTLQVINTDTGVSKKQIVGKRGYVYVTLALKEATPRGRKQANVPIHKIIALAMIHNGPYVLIEHIDDNPLNNDPSNLKFSDKRSNAFSMYRNGIDNHPHKKKYIIRMLDGNEYMGTIKELSAETGIPKGTIYDQYYKYRKGSTLRNKYLIDSVMWINRDEQTGQTTMERIANA